MALQNDFLPFATGVGANVLSQSAYAALSAISTGYQSGVAQSNALNKTWRQSSIMAAVLAQLINNNAGQPAVDDGTTATLLANLTTAISVIARQNPVLTDTGTANAYVVANAAALTAYPTVSGLTIDVSIANTNTGASTLNVDGLGTKPILGLGLQPLQGNELPQKGVACLMYVVASNVNGGNGAWIVMECTGGAQQSAAATASQHAAQFGQIAAVQGAFKNLQASATGTNANVSVSADEIVLENGSNLYVTARNVSLTINSAATGANGLDTGTLAASTWYSKWVIWNGTTVAGLLSLSATAPTMPSGYTHKARVGWIRTDGTGFKYPLSYTQYGRSISYKVAAGSNVTALPGIAAGAQGTVGTTLVQVTGIVNLIPTTASKIHAVLYATNGSSTQLSPNSNASLPAGPSIFCGSPTGVTNQAFASLQLEGNGIWYAGTSSGTNSASYCIGWEDNL